MHVIGMRGGLSLLTQSSQKQNSRGPRQAGEVSERSEMEGKPLIWISRLVEMRLQTNTSLPPGSPQRERMTECHGRPVSVREANRAGGGSW